MKKIVYLFTLVLLFACETDSYETGQGKYSLMQADLCELSVNDLQQATSFSTDDGSTYTLRTPYQAEWIATADTTYRTMIYYNKVTETSADIMGITIIPTLQPIEHWRFKKQPQDPLGFESAWLAKSGKYLNIGLLMKTAYVNDQEEPHTIGLAQDTILSYPDGQRTAYYRLLHSQNGIPEYYTNRRFISILLPTKKQLDTICFCMNTYDGLLEKTFVVRTK